MLKVVPKGSDEVIELDEKSAGDFFKIRYLKHLSFANWTIERMVRKKCQRALKKGVIGECAIWLGKLHERELIEAPTPAIIIRQVHPDVGYGVIAEKDFPMWTFIGEYTGIIRPRGLFLMELNNYCFAYPREWLTLHPLTIDGEPEGNFTRFINHSDKPNLESVAVMQGDIFHILFRTTEKIKAGTELTYNYGDIYWRDRKKIDYIADKFEN